MSKLNKETNLQEEKQSWRLLGAAFGFMLCMFAPMQIFFTNETEFWFSLAQMLPVLLAAFAGTTLLLFFLFHFMYKTGWAVSFYGGFLCILLFLYIQGNYIPRDYGVLDGEAIAWDSYTGYAAASIVLLLACLMFFGFILWKIKERIFAVGKVLCTILILIQLVTIGTLFIQNHVMTDGDSAPDSVVVTAEGMFDLSEQHNIVIFVLDTFDSSYLQQLLEGADGSRYKELLQDFTYYPDTLGAYSTTKGAMPHLMTGVAYENEKPYDTYVNDAFTDNAVYKELEKNHYSVGIYTDPLYLSDDIRLYDNVKKGHYVIGDQLSFAEKIFGLVAFCYLPHQWKKYFPISTEVFDSLKEIAQEGWEKYPSDVKPFYDYMQKEGITAGKENCFRLYHLSGVHPPYTFDGQLRSEESMIYDAQDEAAGNLYVLDAFLKALKEQGIYDRTSILVMSDHGHVGLSQNPVFLVKNEGENHAFAISDEEMSYRYLTQAYLSLAGGGKLDEACIRECRKEMEQRTYLYYSWDDSWDKQYLPGMVEYTADGNAQEVEHMRATGNCFLSGETDFSYDLGKTLVFGNTALPWQIYGFSVYEEEFTWTDGTSALMQFDITQEFDNLSLHMNYGPYLYGQRVAVYANDHPVAEFAARNLEEREIIIPGAYVKDGRLRLRFDLPDAVSPQSMGVRDDARRLALAIRTMTLSSTDKAFPEEEQMGIYEYYPGTELDFAIGSTAETYCAYGFSAPEENLTWTDGKEALMKFRLVQKQNKKEDQEQTQGKEVNVKMSYLMCSTSSQRVRVYANDQLAVEFTAAGAQEQEFSIPWDFITDGKLFLRFALPDAVSPKNLGISEDTRDLALAMEKLTISDAQ